MQSDPSTKGPVEGDKKQVLDADESLDVRSSMDTQPGLESTGLMSGSKSGHPARSHTPPSSDHEDRQVRYAPQADAYDVFREEAAGLTVGDYVIESKIGQGGMGAVFKARQINPEREVALKVLARHLLDDVKFVHRFKREAKLMARLDHPNIIRCFGAGEEEGLHYLAMEFVDGGSLQDLLDKHQVLSVGDSLFVTLQVADALRYAHELNMVHRDVKPDNVLLTSRGGIKLADLGLAKPVNDELSMTISGMGAGTPSFMAPEQMRSAKEVDGRADIYALGAMLYLMLAGKNPFDGESLLKLLEMKEKGRYDPIRRHNPAVPERLAQILDKMLAKSLPARYQSCEELIRDLEDLGAANNKMSIYHPDARPVGSRGSHRDPPSAPGKAATAARPSERGPESGTNLAGWWYIDAGVTEDGRRKVRKLTADQVREQISSGRLDATVGASRQTGGGYRALASYPEFEPLFRGSLPAAGRGARHAPGRSGQTQSAVGMKTDGRQPGLSRFFSTTAGRFLVVLLLALLGAAGYGLYLILS